MLASIGTALVGTTAGCTALSGNGSESDSTGDREYTHLRGTAVYVDDDVSLSLPEDVPTVSATNNADLIVLAGDTAVSAEQAVEWLADEHVLALLGDEAEATWIAWARSDVYQDTFRSQGISDSDPDPDLLIAVSSDLTVSTHNYTWANGPNDHDRLQALDETIAEIEETPTPH